ncbi:CoA transferase [Streptosporangium longisporum]|uniref:Carnitine dehydratase n=1 Tax=Streptosporangium longisporum TaxID=46187 RepID=A0ABP6LCD5_9ACTN
MVEDHVRKLAAELGITLPPLRVSGSDPVLPSVFRVGTAAAIAVGAATAAVAAFRGDGSEAAVDVREAAVAFRDERHLRINGAPVDLWAPLSGDYRTADGWVRLHCNFDHHRDAALMALDLPAGANADAVIRACAGRGAVEIEEAVTRAGGCAAAMRDRAEWRGHPQFRAVAASPLVRLTRIDGPDGSDGPARPDGPDCLDGPDGPDTSNGSDGPDRSDGPDGPDGFDRPDGPDGPDGPDRPIGPVGFETRGGIEAKGGTGARPGTRGERALEGVRVLDLTRVLSGPYATRVLASHGARVLRVGAGHLPEVPGAVIGSAFGKRSCHLDLRTRQGRAGLRALVAGADVFVQSYRPGALEALGFGPRELAAIRPGIVCVDISAYGGHGPWAGRRGFDSLVQIACGIAHEGGDGSRPCPLPAQVLDHATGHLAAFGAVAGLLRRSVEGGSWRVELSLARTAHWLDGLGRVDGAATPEPDVADLLQETESAFGRLTHLRPPGTVGGRSPYWSSPPPRQGEHPPAWW